MGKLEDLVPSLELCKQIPEGEFVDRCFVWSWSCDRREDTPFIDDRDCVEFCRRGLVNAPPMYPAPTLAEILAKIGDDPRVSIARASRTLGGWRVTAQNERGNCSYSLFLDDNPADAALRLGFEVEARHV